MLFNSIEFALFLPVVFLLYWFATGKHLKAQNLLLLDKNRKNLDIVAKGKILPSFREVGSMAGTFILTLLAWIFFRARDVRHAFAYIREIFSESVFLKPFFHNMNKAWLLAVLLMIFMIMEWLGRQDQYAIQRTVTGWPKPARWAFYYTVTMVIFLFAGKEQTFIYFQF